MSKTGLPFALLAPFLVGTTLGYFLRPIQHFVKRGLLAIATVLLINAGIYLNEASEMERIAFILNLVMIPISLGMIAGRYCRIWTTQYLSARPSS